MMSSSLGGRSGLMRTGEAGARLRMDSKIRPEVSPRKGKHARGHFVEDDAEGKQIAARVHFFAADLFRGHVGDGTERGAGAGEIFGSDAQRGSGVGFRRGASQGRDFGEAEIEDLGIAALGDENVCGLDVAVDDALRMGGIESVGDFDGIGEELIEFEGAAGDDVLERGAIEKFHGDEGFAGVFADVVDGADVGMVQRGGGAGFAFEAFQRLGVVGDVFREEFEGDEAAQAGIFGFVDYAHATAAEFFDDAIVRNGLAGQRRRVGHVRGF